MGAAALDASTRRAVGEVVRLAREAGGDVAVPLAAFAVRAAALDAAGPPVALDASLSAEGADALARRAAERVLRKDDPALEMVRLQVALDTEFARRSAAVEAAAEARAADHEALAEAILAASVRAEGDEALAVLQRHVFAFVCARASLDAALRGGEAEAEVAAALESVFPAHGLQRFAALEGGEKRAQLVELALIVLGIRLFNRAVGKGGGDLADARGDYRARAAGARRSVQALAAGAAAAASRHRLALEHAAARAAPRAPPMLRLRDEYHNRAQYAAFAKALARDVGDGARTFAQLEADSDREMDALRELIGGRASVPKSRVYPHFESLGALHLAMVDEAASLGVHEAVLAALEPFASGGFTSVLTSRDVSEAQAATPAPPLESREGAGVPPPPSDPEAAAAAAGATRVLPESLPVEEYGAITPELAGHCPVTAACRAGLALPGDARLGYVAFEGKHYACVSEAATASFAAAPREYIAAVYDMARSMPELIRLMQLQEQLPPELVGGGSAGVVADAERLPCDFGTQTPTHFVDKHIDVNYEWNEWAMRRRLIRLTNLRQKKTHSTQSMSSHFRREAESQVWLPKQALTQTVVNKGTAMPRKLRYVAGLRGAPNTVMHVCDLKLDLGQPHE